MTRGPAENTSDGHYRPHLDGLRAVAVYLVVAFHGGSRHLEGGYIGVDVFFVLSGYLVTQLLRRDLEADGSISLRRFYARRFRRLLPAAAVVLVVTALVFSALASPVEVAEARDGMRAAFLYVSNWHFISQSSDYFAADVATNPVLHFWSLSVEEQFYLLWPLLLGGLYAGARRFGRRQHQVVRAAVLVGGLASFGWAWHLRGIDLSRAYYGTDARAYQLLAGAILALTPGLVHRVRRGAPAAPAVAIAALAGLVVTASSGFELGAIERGLLATVVTMILLVALETAAAGPVHRLLTLDAVVYLGRISYGTYLWHWLVIIVMERTFDLSAVTTVAVAALLATALASLSHALLEQPIRTSVMLDRHRSAVIACGLAVSVAGGLVVVPAITEAAPRSAASPLAVPPTGGLTPVPADLDVGAIRADFPELTGCLDEPAEACTIATGSGPHLLLIGDSHAEMMIPTFEAIAERDDLTLSVSVQFVCPWQRGLYAQTLNNPERWRQRCEEGKDDLYERVVPALMPDVVVVMNRGYEEPDQEILYLGPDGNTLPGGSPELAAWLESTTRDSVEALTAADRSVLLLEPIPYTSLNQLSCLAESRFVEPCRMVVDTRPSEVESIYRELDEDNELIWAADLDPLVCPFLPICDPIVNGLFVRTDWTHLTSTFARSLAPPVGDYLAANGLIR